MEAFTALIVTHGLTFAFGFLAGGIICYRWAKRSSIGKEALDYVDGKVSKAGKK